MTMTDTGLTLRERIEAKRKDVHQWQAKLDALGDRVTSDDYQASMDTAAELATLLEQYRTENQLTDVVADADQLLAHLEGGAIGTITTDGDARATAAGVPNPKGKTFGEMFVESDMFAQFIKQNCANGQVKGIGGNTAPVLLETPSLGIMNLQTGSSDTSGGAFIEPDHLPGYVDTVPFRELKVWDLCTRIPVTGDTFDYVEVDSKTNNAAPTAEAISAGGLASDGHPDAVTDVDGGLAPESDLSTVKRTVTIEDIPHIMYVTRRAAADAPQLMEIVNGFMGDGLDVESEDQIMDGNGTSPNLRGLLNTTNPYALNAFDMSVAGVTSRITAVLRAMAVVRTQARRRPSAMLIHPDDWFGDEFLAKVESGIYALGDPRASMEQLNAIWGLRVVDTEAIAAGTQLVGDFRQAIIGDRQQTVMYLSDSNRNLFERGILTLRAEKRFGFGVLMPKAFCTVVA